MRKMEMITVYVPRGLLDRLDNLVREGYYPNRSEAIREAIRDLVNYHEKSGGDENLSLLEVRKSHSK